MLVDTAVSRTRSIYFGSIPYVELYWRKAIQSTSMGVLPLGFSIIICLFSDSWMDDFQCFSEFDNRVYLFGRCCSGCRNLEIYSGISSVVFIDFNADYGRLCGSWNFGSSALDAFISIESFQTDTVSTLSPRGSRSFCFPPSLLNFNCLADSCTMDSKQFKDAAFAAIDESV